MDWSLLPNTVALAAVAVLGYLFGRSALRRGDSAAQRMRRELRRAQFAAADVERIAQHVRRNLAAHHGSILHFQDQFQQRLDELGVAHDSAAARLICHEAEQLLRPTAELAAHMASAYNQLRRKSNVLASSLTDKGATEKSLRHI